MTRALAYRSTLHTGAVLSYTGLVIAFAGVLMATPLLLAAFEPLAPGDLRAFAVPSAVSIVLGLALWRAGKASRMSDTLTVGDGGAIVLLGWVSVCLLSAWPVAARTGFDPTRALFESVSGWTTTGLTVVDLETAPRTLLLWRSIMQLAGGAGFAILVLTAITASYGTALSLAEGRGEQLVPQVRRSARIVLTIYACYAVVGTLGYGLVGMEWFDAVNHAFTAISTGGFSTRTDSIGYWNSPAVEAITLPLMVLGNLNFLTAYLLFRGNLGAAARDGEVRTSAFLLAVMVPLVLWLVCLPLYGAFGKSLRVAIFETTTALTTTGFSTVSYDNWPSFGWVIIIVLMIIGGGTGSTAGGVKQLRVRILAGAALWELRRWALPSRSVVEPYTWRAGQRMFVSSQLIQRVAAFAFLYLSTLAAGTAILAAHGIGLQESAFEFASALGTVGLSIGVTAVSAPDGVLWAQTLAMLLGRLEFFVVITSLLRLARHATR